MVRQQPVGSPEDIVSRLSLIEEIARRLCAASRAAQGLLPSVEDATALDEVAELIRPGLEAAARRKAAS